MRNLLPLILIVLLLSVFLLFWDSQPEYFIQQSAKVTPQHPAPKADSYMRDIETDSYSKTGNHNYQLIASEASFYKRGNFYTVDQPVIKAFDEESPDTPWQLTADSGKVFMQANRIELTDNVRMWQVASTGEQSELTTSQLTLFPEKNLVRSESRVKISTPHGITHGTGMNANFSRQTFTLLKDVSGVHFAQ